MKFRLLFIALGALLLSAFTTHMQSILIHFEAVQDAKDFDYSALSPHSRKLLTREIEIAIAEELAKTNAKQATEARKGLDGDWWCYNNDIVFEARLGLTLAEEFSSKDEIAAARQELEARIADTRASIPPLPDVSGGIPKSNLGALIATLVERDQVWERYVVDVMFPTNDENRKRPAFHSAYGQLVAREKCLVWSANEDVTEQILKEHGWPLKEDIGAHGLWLIIQHADHNPALQGKALPLIEALVDAGAMKKRRYAYLYDRYHLNTDGKQRFGTQVMQDSPGHCVPRPLEEPDRLNELRAGVGLEPFEDYVVRIPGCQG